MICNDDVDLPSDGLGDREQLVLEIRGLPRHPRPRPAVAILQTCRLVNEEGVPILWGKNTFAICLRKYLIAKPTSTSNQHIAVDLTEPFFMHKLRWSTIYHIASLTFTSNSTPLPDLSSSTLRRNYIDPHFTCSGAEILARYTPADFRYSPYGPDQCMSLSIRNWVSTNVTRAELNALQQELEAMMAGDTLLTLIQNDPANANPDAQN